MNIRKIEEKDNLVLFNLIRKCLEDADLAMEGTVYVDDSIRHLSDYYGVDNGEYFVLVDDNDNVIGGIGYGRFEGDICELQKMYLNPDYRGEGLSYKLVDYVCNKAKEFYKKIYLETHTNLNIAIHVYEKSGFTYLDKPLNVAVHSAMNVFMIKDLL
ncbi:MAG: GNAT family N-acetyltransferase [Lachnospiraceae bacterium]|jgi:putative acetyltransferase|nr:GNAT family N-acetyltransferase [Lachnospiraceae bacterium]